MGGTTALWEKDGPVGFGADVFGRPRDGAISPEKENKLKGSQQSHSSWIRNWGFFTHKKRHLGPLCSAFLHPGGTSSAVQ